MQGKEDTMEETENIQNVGSDQEPGVARRMASVLFSPGETFASVNRKVGHPDWVVPLVLVILVGVITVQLAMPVIQKEGFEKAFAQMEQNPNLSDEQRKKAAENIRKFARIGAIAGAPISITAIFFITSAILLALTNFIPGDSGTYKKTLAVVGYSNLVGIPAAIVTSR